MKMMDKSTISVVIVLALAAVVSSIKGGPSIEGSVQAVAWVAPLIGGLISLAGSITGSVLGNKASKKQTEGYDQAWTNYEDWYRGQMNTNILDRADSLSMLKMYREWQDENNKKYQTNAIKGGASEEAKVAYAQKANKGYADVVSRIAAMGQKYKDQLSQGFANSHFNYMMKRADLVGANAQGVASGVANAGGVMGDIIGGMDWGRKTTSTFDPDLLVPELDYDGMADYIE